MHRHDTKGGVHVAQIIKVYKESLPTLQLIGRRYVDADRGPDGGYSHVWDRWFEDGDFDVLEQLSGASEDGHTYVAYMRFAAGVFEYWVGMLFPEETAVPEGYASVRIHGADMGVCWIHGRDDTGELYGPTAFEMCLAEIEKAGWQMADGAWCFERYHPVRFRTPDEAGNVILDFGIELKR